MQNATSQFARRFKRIQMRWRKTHSFAGLPASGVIAQLALFTSGGGPAAEYGGDINRGPQPFEVR